MREIKYIVVHTAAANIRNVDASVIDKWHKERGWEGIGYHFVVLDDKHDSKPDGTIEMGRPVEKVGAHVMGLNSNSVGICCCGDGDVNPFTIPQMTSLRSIIGKLMRDYDVPIENVIGHREVNKLVENGIISSEYRTSKTCPGKKVNMDVIRNFVVEYNKEVLIPTPGQVEEFNKAVAVVNSMRPFCPNAIDSLDSFLSSPQVRFLGRTE